MSKVKDSEYIPNFNWEKELTKAYDKFMKDISKIKEIDFHQESYGVYNNRGVMIVSWRVKKNDIPK